jgi:hypothetical protein
MGASSAFDSSFTVYSIILRMTNCYYNNGKISVGT